MVIFVDHQFCLCGLLAVQFVVKPCNGPHDTDKDCDEQCSSEVKL